MTAAEERIVSKGALFFSAEGELLAREDFWQDYNHLNAEGARLFSRELGGRIGTALGTAGSTPRRSDGG